MAGIPTPQEFEKYRMNRYRREVKKFLKYVRSRLLDGYDNGELRHYALSVAVKRLVAVELSEAGWDIRWDDYLSCYRLDSKGTE
jgi:hypothetical protein